MEAFCVKCSTKREIQAPEPVVMKNGRDAVKGTCPACHGTLFRIGKAA